MTGPAVPVNASAVPNCDVGQCAPTQKGLANVSVDNGPSAASDFSKLLEGYRAKSDKMNASAQSAKSGSGPSAPMMQQLSDLYNYSVETQLIVRTANQAVSGMRQLVTGQ